MCITRKIIIKSKSRRGNYKPTGLLLFKNAELSDEQENKLKKRLKEIEENGGLVCLSVGGDADVKYFKL